MANQAYTILVIPDKTSQVRRVVIPTWAIRTATVAAGFAVVLCGILFLDYWFILSQLDENKQLKLENRRMKQQVQIFKNKITSVEGTMERLKSFATRLKVITNIDERGSLLQSLNQKLPDASQNIGIASQNGKANSSTDSISQGNPTNASTKMDAPGFDFSILDKSVSLDPEEAVLRKDSAEVDRKFSDLNVEALYVEQMLQELYELLSDQKAFLAALPTRKPATGFPTSGFGVRRSPFGGRVKMHEGLDIANYPGTPIRATADGQVVYSEIKSGYGQTVIIDHGYGLETLYAHNRKVLVKKGQRVNRGETIALLGNSGLSTGPHLHYEVRVNGIPVDPITYLLEN